MNTHLTSVDGYKKIKVDIIFYLLFLEDDVGRKWIKIDKSRRVL